MIIRIARDYILKSGLTLGVKDPQNRSSEHNRRLFSKGICQGEGSWQSSLYTPQIRQNSCYPHTKKTNNNNNFPTAVLQVNNYQVLLFRWFPPHPSNSVIFALPVRTMKRCRFKHTRKLFHTVLFILFMGFSRQEYWSGLPFPSPVDHILSDLSTMTRPSWVAPHGVA